MNSSDPLFSAGCVWKERLGLPHNTQWSRLTDWLGLNLIQDLDRHILEAFRSICRFPRSKAYMFSLGFASLIGWLSPLNPRWSLSCMSKGISLSPHIPLLFLALILHSSRKQNEARRQLNFPRHAQFWVAPDEASILSWRRMAMQSVAVGRRRGCLDKVSAGTTGIRGCRQPAVFLRAVSYSDMKKTSCLLSLSWWSGLFNDTHTHTSLSSPPISIHPPLTVHRL